MFNLFFYGFLYDSFVLDFWFMMAMGGYFIFYFFILSFFLSIKHLFYFNKPRTGPKKRPKTTKNRPKII
jgi:hypothetical protein